jgi:hypothetical protein
MRQTALHNSIHNRSSLQETAEGRESILKTLAYFDIFHYPLTKEEILQFLGKKTTPALFGEWLHLLLNDKAIFLHHDFYSLQDNPLLAHRRRQGNARAEKLIPKAMAIGRFLSRFPYVNAVGISGSLSKNYADEKSDIDFFIVTKANRLWIARTFMHLFKKLTFLTGRQHLYCMNYYVDEKALLLQEKNIFTAIELKTLLPVSGDPAMQQLFHTNQWADIWLPCCDYRTQPSPHRNNTWLKKSIEWMFDNRMGQQLNHFLFRATTRRWNKKEQKGKRNKKGLIMGLETDLHFARSNPGAFQEKVLEMYQQKLGELKIDITYY